MTPSNGARTLIVLGALLVLLGAGCGGPKTFQGPEGYTPPTAPPPSSSMDSY